MDKLDRSGSGGLGERVQRRQTAISSCISASGGENLSALALYAAEIVYQD